MNKSVIERDFPSVGGPAWDGLPGSAAQSRAAPVKLASDVHWLASGVAGDGTFRVYLPVRGADVRQHAERPDGLAGKVTGVTGVIDPTTEDT